MLAILIGGISGFLSIYWVMLIVRILLSWFPNLDWSNPVLSTLSQLTDPYLNIFRSIIPPMGGIDFSSILAIIILQIVASQVGNLAQEIAYSSNSFLSFSAF